MKKLQMDDLQRKTVEEYKGSAKNKVVVVLDNIRSLNNVGSIFRTADAFMIEALYLCGITGTPPNKDIYKTALGSSETVNWKYFESTEEAVKSLKNNGYKVYALEQAEGSIYLDSLKETPPLAIIVGNEVEGVSQEIIDLCEGCIEIPQWGTKHSLNVSIAAGITLWQICSRNHLSLSL